jgi:PKD repeat protein
VSYTTLKAQISQIVAIEALSNGPVTAYEDETITFSAARSTGDIAKYVWDFGDGERAEGVTVDHAYDTADTYTVTLRITGDEGGNDVVTTSAVIQALTPPNPEWTDDRKPAVTRTDLTGYGIVDGYPHVCGGSLVTTLTDANQYRCWPFMLRKNFQLWEGTEVFDDAKAANEAEGRTLHFATIDCPQEWQGLTDVNVNYWHVSGPQIEGLAATTTETELFPGHLLLGAAQALLNNMSTSSTSLYLADVSDISIGDGLLIRDAGAWTQAEIMQVSGISGSGPYTVTVSVNPWGEGSTRAFRGSTYQHGPASTEAVVARIQRGNGEDPNFAYNFGTTCPTDGAGNTYADFRSTWIATYFDKTRNQNPALRSTVPLNVRGVYYDSDFAKWWMGGADKFTADFNNDGTADAGIVGGVDVHLNGLIEYSGKVRAKLDVAGHDDAMLWGGEQRAWVIGHIESNDFEAGPSGCYGRAANTEDYAGYIHRYLAQYKMSEFYNDIGPNLSFSQFIGYDGVWASGTGGESARQRVKLQAGIDQIFGGWFSVRNFTVNTTTPAWRWFDLFAVDSNGDAVSPTDYANIRANLGWLGSPTGYGYRVVDITDWEEADDLLGGNGLVGWVGTTNTSVSSVTGGIQIEPTTTPNPPSSLTSISSAYATGPSVTLTTGNVYTVCAKVNVENARCLQIRLGSDTTGKDLRSNHLFSPPGEDFWHVLTFESDVSGSTPIHLDVGDEDGYVQLKDLKIFAENGYIFRRDFANGAVIVNASPVQVQVDLTGEGLEYINSNQFPDHDGSAVTTLTLPARDAAFLRYT